TAGIGTPYYWRYFAKNLTPGAHTIRVTRTGYANVSASNSRLYISGMFYRIGDETMPSADTFLIPLSNISAAASRWEFAFSVKPTGASALEWMGHTNSERNRIAPVLTIGGTPAAWPTSGMPLVGSSITVDVDTYLRHSEMGTTDVASVTRRYTLNAAGLAHSFAYTWEVESVVTAAFPTMLPADNNFSRGSMVGASVDYTLLDDDNSETAKFPSQAGYLWEGSGKWPLAVYLPDLAQTMDNYDAPNTGMYFQDR